MRLEVCSLFSSLLFSSVKLEPAAALWSLLAEFFCSGLGLVPAKAFPPLWETCKDVMGEVAWESVSGLNHTVKREETCLCVCVPSETL